MTKSIEKVIKEINVFIDTINQDLQISTPSKLLSSKSLGALANGAILGAIAGRFPMIDYMVEQNALWEKRQVAYKVHYPEKPADYNDTLKVYQTFVEIGQATREGFTPDRAFWVGWGLRYVEGVWLTVKEMAERTVKRKLPDIDPQDAIELGKTTPYSAEQWFRGCSDRKFWE